MKYLNKLDIIDLLKGCNPNSIMQDNTIIIDVTNISPNQKIIIENQKFDSYNISINGNNSNFKIEFNNCDFNNLGFNGEIFLSFIECKFNEVKVKDAIGTYPYSFQKSNIKKLHGRITNLKFNLVQVDNLVYNTNLKLDGFSKIKTLTFKKVTSNIKIDLSTKINNIEFDNFNSSRINLEHVFQNFKSLKNAKLIVRNSNLNQVNFYNCDFSNARLEFYDSNLLDLHYVNTRLPFKAFELNTNTNSREAYRQLKIVSIKHFDRFNELKYKAREQDAYLKELNRYVKQSGNLLISLKHRCLNFNSWLILGFNKVSNYYGTRWWQALLLILVLGFGFYCLYLSSISNNIFGYNEFAQKYFQFISPFHNMELLGSEYEYSASSYFIDIFHRIINYFLIYQGVQAFRMYGKS